MQDPYQVLGVSRNADEKEITAAYRKLAKKYHPDLNPGDAQAAKKMGEINAAYDAVKNGTAGSSYQSGYGGSYSSYGQSYSRSSSAGTQNGYSYYDAVENYLRNGYYREAFNVLQGIAERDARWYYYSAAANSGLGNNIVALEHARKAVDLEPSNMMYRSMLNDLENGGSGYFARRQTYGAPAGFGFGSCCAAFLLFRFISSCFCRPC